MQLLISSLKKEVNTLLDNNVRLTTIGNISLLPKKVYDELKHVIEITKSNTRLTSSLNNDFSGMSLLI